PFPIAGHAPGRARHWLVDRVAVRGSQARTLERLPSLEVPVPVLAGLEALNDGVPRLLRVPARMLIRRGGAAADVPALRAAAQVKPPAIVLQALDAAGPARRLRWIDVQMRSHRHPLSLIGRT